MHSLHMHSHSIDNRSKYSNSSMCTYYSNSSTANKPIHDMHSIMAQYVFWIDLHAVLYTVVIMQIINNWVSHADIWILEVTG